MLLKTLRAGASAVKRALHPVRPVTDDLPFELEDRIGKSFIRERSTADRLPRGVPVRAADLPPAQLTAIG